MKYCPNCKHENNTDAIFCEKCGKSLTSSNPSQNGLKTSTKILIIGIIVIAAVLGVSVAFVQTSFINTNATSLITNQTPPNQNSTVGVASSNESNTNINAESKYITLTCQRCGKQFQVLREGEHPYYCDDCLRYIASQKQNGQNTN